MSIVPDILKISNTEDFICMVSKYDIKWSKSKIKTQTFDISRSLIQLGIIPRYESVSIFAGNSPEWVMFLLGTIIAGSKGSILHYSSNYNTCEYILNDSVSRVIFVDSRQRLDLAIKAKSKCTRLKHIVLMKGCDELLVGAPSYVYGWEHFIELGKRIRHEIVYERIDAQKPSDCCMLVYTSGTTGNSKGIMLSHDNIIWTTKAHIEHNPILLSEKMRMLSFLPISHIAPIMFDMFVPLMCNYIYNIESTVFFSSKCNIDVEELKRVRPTVIFGVPRVWEKLADISKKIEPKYEGIIYRKMKEICKKSHINRQISNHKVDSLFAKYATYYMKSRIQFELGLNECKLCFTGGAPTNPNIFEYFSEIGIDIIGAYGMSELSGSQCYSKPESFIDGYSGLPVPGTEVKVEPATGELCFRGRQVMLGYNGDKSPCIDEDGWFHSGDIGEIHESGHIKVTGRKGDIMVTSYGKNINPIPIENYLRTTCDDIQDILIIGDSRKYLSAMFSLKPGGCVKSVLKCIDAYNVEVSGDKCEIIHRVMYTKDIFTIEGGEITPSNKVRRFNILEKYRDEIEGMYYNFY